ncbi:MAG: hypothetical protein ACLVKR_02550 [Lachnospiraceae bacterium]
MDNPHRFTAMRDLKNDFENDRASSSIVRRQIGRDEAMKQVRLVTKYDDIDASFRKRRYGDGRS